MEKKKYSSEQKNTIFVSVVTSFITTFMGSALTLSVPGIEKEFHVSAAAVGWVVTVYMLTCAALAVPFGRIADIFQRKRILWLGILIFAIASLAAIFSFNLWILLIFRFFQGLGASMIFSTNIAILAGAFEGDMRGKVLGYSTSSTYVGLAAGPVLGGIINYNFGWRAVFIATALVSGVAFFCALKKLPKSGEEDDSPNKKKNMDWRGNILYIASLVAMMYGLSSITTMNLAPLILVTGIILLILFGINERKVENPLMQTDIFKNNSDYVLSNLAALVNYGSTFIITYLISLYLQVIMGYSSQMAGVILIVSPVIMSLLSPLTGKLSDKYSPHLMSAAGMTLCAFALLLFAFFMGGTSLMRIILILALSGLGFSLFSAPNTNAVMAAVNREEYGVATSVLSTMRSIGHTTAMAIVTVIMGQYMGNMSFGEAEPLLLSRAMRVSFFVFAGFCICGIFMALKRKVCYNKRIRS